jgi:hypothetical protein
MAIAAENAPQTVEMASVLDGIRTESSRTLLELVDESPVLLIFLRHFGCAFCRQTLDDVSKLQAELARRKVRPVFVHLGTPERAKPFFDHYNLAHVERISNPEGNLYGHAAFKLGRLLWLTQFLHLAVWKGWLRGAIASHGIGLIREDASQMPGVFFLRDRAIVSFFRHRTTADRPDYLGLIT